MLRPNIWSWWLLSHCYLGLHLTPVYILLFYPVLNRKLLGAELLTVFFHIPTVPDTWSIIMEINILQSLLLILQKSLFNSILGGNAVNFTFYIVACSVALCSCFVILVPSCKVSGKVMLLFFAASKSITFFQEQLRGTSTIKIPYQLSHINCAYFLLI